MSRKFTLIKDYYDEGFNLYKKKTITIKPGVTVLVGCNGIGKTTLLHQIRDRLKVTQFQKLVSMEILDLWRLLYVHLKVRIL